LRELDKYNMQVERPLAMSRGPGGPVDFPAVPRPLKSPFYYR